MLYVAKFIRDNGEISSSDPFEQFRDAQEFAWKSKDDPVSIVITQIDENSVDVMDHWLKRLKSHPPTRDVPLDPIARSPR